MSNMSQVYIALKFHPDHSNRGLVDRITDAFASRGVESVCVARDIDETPDYPAFDSGS